MYKSAFAAIVGRPSAGKSTLLNAICGHKVSIVSAVPQTTRNKVRGIFTNPDGQIVFIDTPGFHFSDKKMNHYLVDVMKNALKDAEVVLYLIDSTRPPGEEEKQLSQLLLPYKDRMVIAVNKIDDSESKKEESAAFVRETFNMEPLFVSAKKEDNIVKLINAVFDKSPEGEPMYPSEFYTDQEPEFRISEIIREKAMNRLKEELPHSIYVEIADLERKEDGELWIRAFLIVERDSQKGIVVGKGGEMLHSIRTAAKREIKGIFDGPIKLDLSVKTRSGWRQTDHVLKKITS